MRPKDLYQILHRQPFQPVRIQLTDGRSFDIRDPHQAVVGISFLDIWIPAPDLPEGIYDHVEMIDPAAIARVDLLETGASPAFYPILVD